MAGEGPRRSSSVRRTTALRREASQVETEDAFLVRRTSAIGRETRACTRGTTLLRRRMSPGGTRTACVERKTPFVETKTSALTRGTGSLETNTRFLRSKDVVSRSRDDVGRTKNVVDRLEDDVPRRKNVVRGSERRRFSMQKRRPSVDRRRRSPRGRAPSLRGRRPRAHGATFFSRRLSFPEPEASANSAGTPSIGPRRETMRRRTRFLSRRESARRSTIRTGHSSRRFLETKNSPLFSKDNDFVSRTSPLSPTTSVTCRATPPFGASRAVYHYPTAHLGALTGRVAVCANAVAGSRAA
jgi:hypothetical protein